MPGHTCLFCFGDGPFTTVEHIIPESLGNDDLLLRDEVCDGCQRYLGKEVENYVLSKTPIGVWRMLLGIRTKKGRLPQVDLSNPAKQKGILPELSQFHDNKVGFTAHEDGSTSVDIDDPELVRELINGERRHFRFVLSPKHLVQIGRFLGKIGIEMLCAADPEGARSNRYEDLRKYVRYGIRSEIWPVFHSVIGDLHGLRKLSKDEHGLTEEVFCYQYSILSVQNTYDLFSFRVGVDHWIICMNDPYPTPIIRDAFPGAELQLVWYSRKEWPSERNASDAGS